jgi:hypothetical protein
VCEVDRCAPPLVYGWCDARQRQDGAVGGQGVHSLLRAATEYMRYRDCAVIACDRACALAASTNRYVLKQQPGKLFNYENADVSLCGGMQYAITDSHW